MGKATRWFKSLFGIKSNSADRNEKKHTSFGHSRRDAIGLCHNPTTIPPNMTSAEAAWIRSYFATETEQERSKHAIAVAAATAAAADAAVLAAQAAAAVVRLTSNGRGTIFAGGHERFAAVKIQTLFRAYLARKALRALKGLVKLQAVVRGYLVRKQATATLHSMQALIRAQTTIRKQRARARKSMERFDEVRSENSGSIHSRRLSGCVENTTIEETSKIVEIDTGYRPKSRSRRTISDFNDEPPSSIQIPDCCCNLQDSEWGLTGEECRFSTAQSTPRFSNSGRLPVTPSESVCGDNFFTNNPNYMANTKSFKAKLRSHSAPKQRPEPAGPIKKRISLNELMESRNSLSGTKMQRSCSQVQQAINFKNVVMGKLDRSLEFVRDPQRNRNIRV